MHKLKNWRLRLKDDGNFIMEGTDEFGYKISKEIVKDNIRHIKLNTAYLQISLKDRVCGFILWFENADMTKPITPMRAVKRQPKRFMVDAVYCMMAEVSMYVCGFSKEVDKEYLQNERNIGVFFNDDPNDEYGFAMDIAIKLLLRAADGVEKSSFSKYK